MAELVSEYTDTKNIKHAVEHLMPPANEDTNRERIIDDILSALQRKRKVVRA